MRKEILQSQDQCNTKWPDTPHSITGGQSVEGENQKKEKSLLILAASQGKGLCASLATILKISPAFFLSLVHRWYVIWEEENCQWFLFAQGWQHSCCDNDVAALRSHLHCSWTSPYIHRGLQKVEIWSKNIIWSDLKVYFLFSTNYLGAATDVRAGLALFYVLTNVTILAKCPLGNRHTNHTHMIEVER